jgi:transcriptional regulator NrdR family protein
MKKKCVVKRRGHEEKYDVKKAYASVYSAALSCHYKEQKSEKLAKKVTDSITSWVKRKGCVGSNEIRDEIIKKLKEIDKDVALMYGHHLDLS